MPIYVPAEPYPKKENDSIRSSDWNSAIDEVVRLSVATQQLDRNTFNGPLTVNGALTASGGLTVTGNQSVSGTLTASGGINGPLTVTGAVTVNGVLGVSGFTRISQQNNGNWAIFGANMYSNGSAFKQVNTAQPGANLHISAEGGGTSEFRFCLMNAGETNQRNIATIGTGGLTVTGGINGPITVNGALTVTGAMTANAALTVSGALRANGGITGPLTISDSVTCTGSFLSVEGLAVVSTNIGAGRWASFGSNAYYRGNQWNLANTAQPGVCLVMSGPGGGSDREFAFCRMEAGSNTGIDLVKMGRDGIVVYNGKKVATGHEFLYIIRGKVNANGSVGAGSGFTASKISTGYYQITFSSAFSSLPIAVATQYLPSTSDTRDNAVIVDLATSLIKVKVGTGGGAVADRDFTFIAVGPRTT